MSVKCGLFASVTALRQDLTNGIESPWSCTVRREVSQASRAVWEFIVYMVTHSLCPPVTAIRLERRGKGSRPTWDTSFLHGRHQSLGRLLRRSFHRDLRVGCLYQDLLTSHLDVQERMNTAAVPVFIGRLKHPVRRVLHHHVPKNDMLPLVHQLRHDRDGVHRGTE